MFVSYSKISVIAIFFVLIFVVFISVFQSCVFCQSFSTTDDLYIEGQPSGDLPVDDEDGEDDGSGSGSGDYGKMMPLSQPLLFLK